jgi:hypothetical protein
MYIYIYINIDEIRSRIKLKEEEHEEEENREREAKRQEMKNCVLRGFEAGEMSFVANHGCDDAQIRRFHLLAH